MNDRFSAVNLSENDHIVFNPIKAQTRTVIDDRCVTALTLTRPTIVPLGWAGLREVD